MSDYQPDYLGRQDEDGPDLDLLHLADHIHTIHYGSKNDVLAVKVWGRLQGNKELRPISIGPRVGHAEQASPSVLLDEVFILEFAAIDALTASSIAGCEVTAL